jgi:hypothetical protein
MYYNPNISRLMQRNGDVVMRRFEFLVVEHVENLKKVAFNEEWELRFSHGKMKEKGARNQNWIYLKQEIFAKKCINPLS